MPRLSLCLVALMTLAVAACGVKGPLELPPGAQPAPAQTSAQGATASQNQGWAAREQAMENQSGGSTAGSSFGWGRSDSASEKDHLRGAQSPDKPFALDWLL